MDEDELQSEDDSSTLAARRQNLFASEDSGVEDFIDWGEQARKSRRSQRDAEEDAEDEDRLREQTDRDMTQWATETLASRRRANDALPPPPPPKIESDFTIHASTPFGREEVPSRTPFLQKVPAPCPTASISCDSISASKAKCGFSEYTTPSTPPKLYLTQTTDFDDRDGFGPPDYTCRTDRYLDVDKTETYDSVTCVLTCSGTASCRTVITGPSPPCTPSDTTVTWDPCTGGGVSCVSNYAGLTTTTTPTTITRSGSGTTPDIPRSDYAFTEVTTLSNEYTTATLKSNTIATLPAYSGFGGPHSVAGQGVLCSAYANLATNETSYTIRRFKYKFTLSDPACAGMIVSWRKVFTPAGGGAPTYTAMSWTAVGDEIETSVYTENEPSSNGTTTIDSIAVDCSGCPPTTQTVFGEIEA